jgi:hypothetical protein
MRKAVFILAAFVLAACNVREESHGEVVDTLIDNSKVTIDSLGTTIDTVPLPTLGTDTNMKKPVGRKPVDMKDSLRRP